MYYECTLEEQHNKTQQRIQIRATSLLPHAYLKIINDYNKPKILKLMFIYLFRCYYNIGSITIYGAYVGVPTDPNAQ